MAIVEWLNALTYKGQARRGDDDVNSASHGRTFHSRGSHTKLAKGCNEIKFGSGGSFFSTLNVEEVSEGEWKISTSGGERRFPTDCSNQVGVIDPRTNCVNHFSDNGPRANSSWLLVKKSLFIWLFSRSAHTEQMPAPPCLLFLRCTHLFSGICDIHSGPGEISARVWIPLTSTHHPSFPSPSQTSLPTSRLHSPLASTVAVAIAVVVAWCRRGFETDVAVAMRLFGGVVASLILEYSGSYHVLIGRLGVDHSA
ncbi:hypothetical protein PoB_006302600 [Plakobranchus ocellatus]|uniref:Uncharacterized protein n=1 Tax=Plakobranchus ocellatus TaxID=259542 RepID=A0AAV4CXA4_9GAST|nr:hypothetical protein PoB_006302600 [Plakobranchus ocellatus]